MSIARAWGEFKTYCDGTGPDRGRPARPAQCAEGMPAEVQRNPRVVEAYLGRRKPAVAPGAVGA